MTESGKLWALQSATPFARSVGVGEMQIELEAAEVGVWDWNIVTGEVAWSNNLERIHGLASGAFGGSFDAYLADIHPDDRDVVLASIDRAMSQGTDHDVEYRVVLPDGSVRWVAGRGRVFVDASGRPIRMTGTCQDVTKHRSAASNLDESRHELEQRLLSLSAELDEARAELATESEARARAEEAERTVEAMLRHHQKMEALGRLAAGVAHDFNNLLMVVSVSSDLVLEHLGEDDPVRPRIVDIKKAATRGALLTRRFLACSRPTKPDLQVIDIGTTVAETSAMLGRLVCDDVEVVFTRDPEPGLVRIDAGHIDLILMNLVVNARDAMPEGGVVAVATRTLEVSEPLSCVGTDLPPGRYVALSVTDTGCGIDPRTIDRIFDAFFTTKETGRGTGLGLATVYTLVQEAGGAIQITSASGQGTEITIILPWAGSEPESKVAETHSTPSTGAGSVLLVEPDAAVSALLREVLEHAGYDVLQARNRQEAMSHCADPGLTIDLIVADAPPHQPGSRSLVDIVRALRPGIPTVLLTDGLDVYDADPELNGRVVVVAKPIGPEAFMRHVHEALVDDRAE